MPNKSQLSAGEAFDDFTGQPVGEGYLTFQSSAGNRLVFDSPANYNNYRIANPDQFADTPNTGGDYNTSDDTV